MLRELAFFGALVPSPVLHFVGSALLFVVLDGPITRLGVYRLTWHPPLARFGLFLCLFAVLVLATRP
jgi:hypothetical protein